MTVYWCGFNGFKQIAEESCNDMPFQCIPLADISEIDFSWICSIIIAGSDIYLSGSCENGSSYMKKLSKPSQYTMFSKVACGESNALFITDNGECWQLFYHNLSWKKLLNFCCVEEAMFSNTEHSKAEGSNQTGSSLVTGDILFPMGKSRRKIIKICRGDVLNVALDNQGIAYSIPSPIILPGTIIKDIACGFEHCIMLDEFGRVFSWGSGMRGQLGREVLETTDVPQEIDALGGLNVTHIAAGGWHSAAVTSCGVLYTWGWNNTGQLGFPSMKSCDNIELHPKKKQENNCSSKQTNESDLHTNESVCNKTQIHGFVQDDIKNNQIQEMSSSMKNLKRIKLSTETETPVTAVDITCKKQQSNDLSSQKVEVNINCKEKIPSNVSSVKSNVKSFTDDMCTSNGKLLEHITVLAVPRAVSFSCNQEIDVLDVSCGNRHTIALTSDGSLWGSGWNAYGQLGEPCTKMIYSDSFVRLHSVPDKMKKLKIHCAGWNSALFLDAKM